MSDTTGTTQAAVVNTEAPAEQNPQAGAVPGKAGATPAQGSPAAQAAAEVQKRFFKVQHADGVEEEVDEDTVLKTYRERKGHQSAANKLLQEGKAAKKTATAFIEQMKDKQKVWEVIQKLGHDPRALAEEMLSEKIKYEMMDPKDRELMEKDRKLKEYESREEKQKREKEEHEIRTRTQHYVKQFNEEIIGALKDSPIPQNKESVKAIAGYIAKYAKHKIPISATEAAKLVEQDIQTSQNSIFKDATPDQLIKLIGKEKLAKLREYDLAQLKNPQDNLKTPEGQGDGKRRQGNTVKRMTDAEWALHKRGF